MTRVHKVMSFITAHPAPPPFNVPCLALEMLYRYVVRPSMHATAAKRSRDEQPQPFASPILGRGGGPDSCPQSLDRTTKHHRMAPARGGRSDEASVAVTPNLKL